MASPARRVIPDQVRGFAEIARAGMPSGFGSFSRGGLNGDDKYVGNGDASFIQFNGVSAGGHDTLAYQSVTPTAVGSKPKPSLGTYSGCDAALFMVLPAGSAKSNISKVFAGGDLK